MNEEELFCKLFPEYVVNGKTLSPYFDLFERGYEEAENRAEELEKACEETQELLDKQIEATYKLDKENAELKARVDNLFNSDCWASEHLTKAKEIIEKLRALYLTPVVTKEDVKKQNEILAEAEQFLSEVNK